MESCPAQGHYPSWWATRGRKFTVFSVGAHTTVNSVMIQWVPSHPCSCEHPALHPASRKTRTKCSNSGGGWVGSGRKRTREDWGIRVIRIFIYIVQISQSKPIQKNTWHASVLSWMSAGLNRPRPSVRIWVWLGIAVRSLWSPLASWRLALHWGSIGS